MKRIGKQTWQFHDVYLTSTGTTVGPLESEGPLKESYDKNFDSLYCGESNWELAERKLLNEAIDICLDKAHKKTNEIDFFLAGDLLNQNVTSNYVARENGIPFSRAT